MVGDRNVAGWNSLGLEGQVGSNGEVLDSANDRTGVGSLESVA